MYNIVNKNSGKYLSVGGDDIIACQYTQKVDSQYQKWIIRKRGEQEL